MSTGSNNAKRGRKGDGSILPRGENKWLVKYDIAPDPVMRARRTRTKMVTGSKADAKKELRRLLTTVDKNTHIDTSRTTVGTWCETWLRDYAAQDVSPKTHERYSQLLNLHVVPTLGATGVQQLKATAIDALYRELGESGSRRSQKTPKEGEPAAAPQGLSAVTVLYVHRVLSLCLAKAMDLEMIDRNPCDKASPPSARKRRAKNAATVVNVTPIKALDSEQLNTLVKGFRDHELFPLVVFAAKTGARRGEFLAVRWSDIDLEAGTVQIVRAVEKTKAHGVTFKLPKTESSARTIGLDPGLLVLLKAERNRQREEQLALGKRLSDDALVFPASPVAPEAPRDPESVSKMFRKRVVRLGFKGFRLHDLRHTLATLLLLAGVPINAVAQRLGHSSPVTTMTVYAHVLKRAEDKAVEVAGGLLLGVLSQPTE